MYASLSGADFALMDGIREISFWPEDRPGERCGTPRCRGKVVGVGHVDQILGGGEGGVPAKDAGEVIAAGEIQLHGHVGDAVPLQQQPLGRLYLVEVDEIPGTGADLCLELLLEAGYRQQGYLGQQLHRQLVLDVGQDVVRSTADVGVIRKEVRSACSTACSKKNPSS